MDKKYHTGLLTCLVWVLGFAAGSPAADAIEKSDSFTLRSSPAASPRYGPLGFLDHRSRYGSGFFPEPFLTAQGDATRELNVTWLHTEGEGQIINSLDADLQWSFGLLTLNVQIPYENLYATGYDPQFSQTITFRDEGISSIRMAARHPVYQWVSPDASIDDTTVFSLELDIPSNSVLGKSTSVSPSIFNLLRLGEHVGVQTHVAYTLIYGEEDTRKRTLEYAVDFSYRLTKADFPLPPGLRSVTPMVEFKGMRDLNYGDYTDHLDCVIGGRAMFNAVGPCEPGLGVGFVYPIDKGARDDFTWGIVTSLVFKF